jgi:RNA polymerase sigma-70 factor (ECF subfamily)
MITVDGMPQPSGAPALKEPPRARQKPLPPQKRSTRATRSSIADEARLIQRLQAGDQEAFEAIFQLYSPKLYNVAQLILGEIADAQEVIQDVFWTVFRKAETFRGAAQFSTWLYRLTVNAALGKLRSRKGKDIDYDEFLPKFKEDGHHLVRPVVDWSDSLEERYATQELQQMLASALQQLKPIDRSVVVLSDVEGLTDREIAVALGLTLPAVKTRIHRARLFLRGKLAAQLGYSPA